jgi:hypothetical protein
MPKGFAQLSVIFILIGLFGFFVFQNKQLRAKNKAAISSTTSQSSISPVASCSKSGESPVGNFDERTGKINPNIKVKNCCAGLKAIENKTATINKNPEICVHTIGGFQGICSPCGNNICDSKYEDHCNCPVDCK